MTRFYPATLVVLVVAACVTVDPLIVEEAAKPVTCADKQQCDLYWQRAQGWINKNSRYRIQVVTDTVLSTFGPSGAYDPCCGYSLTRVPHADGGAGIEVDLLCGAYSCSDPEAVLALKQHIRGQ